jgi:hypothetical protein
VLETNTAFLLEQIVLFGAPPERFHPLMLHRRVPFVASGRLVSHLKAQSA